MPIGFNRGDVGGSGEGRRAESRPTRPRSPGAQPTQPASTLPEPPDRQDPLPTRLTRPALVIVARWTRWVTASDERTCPVCAPLEGQLWRDDEGPQPPLHGNCRCTRVLAFIEIGSR